MSGISSTLMRTDVLNGVNITEEDVDYYIKLILNDTFPAPTDVALSRYCGSALKSIRESMRTTHGCLSLIVCLVGSITNALNIVVLGQKELKRAPINQILCSLAVADLLLMVEYIPFACHMYLSPRTPVEDFFSHSWAVFVLFHAHFTQIAHTVSIWLTLTLAFWRFDALRHGRQRGDRRFHQRRCRRAIIAAYAGSVLLCIPSFVTFGIQEDVIRDPHGHGDIVVHMVNLNLVARKNNALIHKLHLWTYSVVMKLVPCTVLTVLTCWLVRRLWEAERHHERVQNTRAPSLALSPVNHSPNCVDDEENNQVSVTQRLEMKKINQNTCVAVEIVITEPSSASVVSVPQTSAACLTSHENLSLPSAQPKTVKDVPAPAATASSAARSLNASHSIRRKQQTDRTTRMLVAVLVLFLATEVPQVVLGLFSVALDPEFFIFCYTGLGEVLDMLALLNASVNFVLYCAMSRQFRTHFRRLMNRLKRHISQQAPRMESPSPQQNIRHYSTSNPTKLTQL